MCVYVHLPVRNVWDTPDHPKSSRGKRLKKSLGLEGGVLEGLLGGLRVEGLEAGFCLESFGGRFLKGGPGVRLWREARELEALRGLVWRAPREAFGSRPTALAIPAWLIQRVPEEAEN